MSLLKPTIITIAFMLMSSLAMSGCNSNQHAGGMKQALASYNAQQYDKAQREATETALKSPAGPREDAAYVAGLSAFQLGRVDDAERQFSLACGSNNPQTAANAKAMMGQIRLDQHRPREAATLFTEAMSALSGDDARKCASNAAVAYQQAGDAASSSKWSAAANNAATSSFGAASPMIFGFTLQVGAFKEKQRAQRAADEIQSIAKRENLGEVRVLPRRDDRGQPMYIVQFGSFPTRDAAAAARTRIGRLQYIVASTGTSSS